MSVKDLTKNSGLLNHLLPGGTTFTDKGFNVEDSLSFSCALISIPAFSMKKGASYWDSCGANKKNCYCMQSCRKCNWFCLTKVLHC